MTKKLFMQAITRFPYLKILVMYECLRLLA